MKNIILHTHIKRVILSTTLGLCLGAVHAPGSEAPVNELNELVGTWTQLRLELAEEQRLWDAQKKQLQDDIHLLEKQKTKLEEAQAETEAFTSTFEKERLILLERKERYEAILSAMKPVLDQAETQLKTFWLYIPEGFHASLKKSFHALPKTQDEADKRALTQRIQVITALLAQLEHLQHNLHLQQEVLDTEQGRRQMDVLYIGLGAGYAVSADDTLAVVGRPGADTWIWTPENDIAPTIRHAIQVFEKNEPAQLVQLPMLVTQAEALSAQTSSKARQP